VFDQPLQVLSELRCGPVVIGDPASTVSLVMGLLLGSGRLT